MFLKNRFERFGAVFQTSLDFSGSFLMARRIICIDSSLLLQVPKRCLRPLAVLGHRGACLCSSDQILQFTHRILSDRVLIQHWEELATPLIRHFLHRLVLEESFSFVERVNE
jgi:hypothetical protein